MAKLERLVRLARLRRLGKPMTVRKLSEACRVSERTIYRYLNTLGDLDVESSFRKPPRGKLAAQLARLELTVDDLELAEYAFRECSVWRYPSLRRRLRKLSQVVAIAVDQTGVGPGTRLLRRKQHFGPARPVAGERVVEKFLKAAGEGRLVDVCATGSPAKVRLRPAQVVIDGGEVILQLVDPANDKSILIRGEEVDSIRMARSRRRSRRSSA
jgi:hypothetical protein